MWSVTLKYSQNTASIFQPPPPPQHISFNVAVFQVVWNTGRTILPLKLIHPSPKTSDLKKEKDEINGYSYF
jgi:hypothetical protein